MTRTEAIKTRVTKKDKKQLQRLAKKQGLSIAELIRQALMETDCI